MFVECEWRQVNKVRSEAQDPAIFDEMYVLLFIHFLMICACVIPRLYLIPVAEKLFQEKCTTVKILIVTVKSLVIFLHASLTTVTDCS